jgi:hypothetical protein
MSKLIVNVSTGEETLRELNKAEIDQQKIDEATTKTAKAEAEARATAKAALLTQLGITAEQAKLLLS